MRNALLTETLKGSRAELPGTEPGAAVSEILEVLCSGFSEPSCEPADRT